MILDAGICKVYHMTNTAAAGAKPVLTPSLYYSG